VVEEDPCLIELVRYIHLDPVRAGLVADCQALRSVPWSGHARFLGEIDDHWQETDAVLWLFGQQVGQARRA